MKGNKKRIGMFLTWAALLALGLCVFLLVLMVHNKNIRGDEPEAESKVERPGESSGDEVAQSIQKTKTSKDSESQATDINPPGTTTQPADDMFLVTTPVTDMPTDQNTSVTKSYVETSKQVENAATKQSTIKKASDPAAQTTPTPIIKQTPTTRHASGEIVALSNQMYSEFKHQTSNTVWNDGSTAQVWHQEQYDYLLDAATKWYEGIYTNTEVCEVMMNCPMKDASDFLQAYGIEFFVSNFIWKVIDCEYQKVEYSGYKTSLTKIPIYEYMCEHGLRDVTRNFLFLKVYYDSENDTTTLYYIVAECS